MPAKKEKNFLLNTPSFIIPEMVKIQGGTFLMGSKEREREQPIHEVTIADFYLGKYLVTNIQYAAFLNVTEQTTIVLENKEKHTFISPDSWGLQQNGARWYAEKGYESHPIIAASWYGAMEYCKWISRQTDNNYQLPSESEWEFAANGGNKSLGFQYAGSNKLKEVGWYGLNSYGSTKPIGIKLPNELGLYDMSGNVWEWCEDYWHYNYKNVLKDSSAWLVGGDKNRRVTRGGSWYRDDNDCRVTSRLRVSANLRDNGVGFRLARY